MAANTLRFLPAVPVLITLTWIVGALNSGEFVVHSDLLHRVSTGWGPVLQGTHNAFFLWRFPAWGDGVMIPLLIIVSGLSCWYHTEAEDLLASVTLAAAIGALLFILFGRDPVLLAAIAFAPWIPVIARHNQASTPAHMAIWLMLGSLLASCANQLGALLGVVMIASTGSRLRPRSALLLLLPSLLVLAVVPPPPVPEYPAHAMVVPDDGVAGFPRPLTGSSPPIPLLDRITTRTIYRWCSVLLLGMSGAAYFILRTRTAGAALIIAMVLAGEVLLPMHLAEIAPLQTIARLVPGLFFFQLAPYALVIALMLLGRTLVSACGMLVAGCSLAALTLVFPLRAGILIDRRADEISRISREEPTPSWILSPSYGVFARIGDEGSVVSPLEGVFQPASRYGATVSASRGNDPERLKHALDVNLGTRWTPGEGQQMAGDTLMITLPTARTIRGVELSPGVYGTDFPRGITVRGSCDPSGEVLLSRTPWLGPVHTTPTGHPYFARQHEVKLVLPRPVHASCISVSLAQGTPNFDWSIAEVNLWIEDERSPHDD